MKSEQYLIWFTETGGETNCLRCAAALKISAFQSLSRENICGGAFPFHTSLIPIKKGIKKTPELYNTIALPEKVKFTSCSGMQSPAQEKSSLRSKPEVKLFQRFKTQVWIRLTTFKWALHQYQMKHKWISGKCRSSNCKK